MIKTQIPESFELRCPSCTAVNLSGDMTDTRRPAPKPWPVPPPAEEIDEVTEDTYISGYEEFECRAEEWRRQANEYWLIDFGEPDTVMKAFPGDTSRNWQCSFFRTVCVECKEIAHMYQVQLVSGDPDDDWIDRYFNGNGPDVNRVHRIATSDNLQALHPRLANEGWLMESMESPLGRYDNHYIGPVLDEELGDLNFDEWAREVQLVLHEDLKALAAAQLPLLQELAPAKAQPNAKFGSDTETAAGVGNASLQ